MSEPNPNNEPMLTPENSAKEQRVRKALTFSIIGATVVGAILLIMALMQHNAQSTYDTGVVIRIDNEPREAHFEMVAAPGQEPAKDGVLVGEPLGNTTLTYNRDVREYYDGLLAEKGNNGGLAGSNNFKGDKGSLCLFYTFYLSNSSTSEDQVFRIECKLNQAASTLQQGEGARAYDYLRLGLYMGDNGANDDDIRYFAAANSKFPTVEAEDDYRETLAGFGTQLDDNGKYRRYPNYYDHDIGYCESFVPGLDNTGLFDIDNLTIPAGGTRRVTFLAYLAGEDPDSYEKVSSGQTLSFSLHIGV